ncbi:MAG TPA: DUF488 domain-containing protein [Actinomycetota bacterium]
MAGEIFTIGHSTHTAAGFVSLLRTHDIERVVDVRTVARSGRHPWFNAEPLEAALGAEGLGYGWLPDVGGLRTPIPGSANDGWTDDAFRGYADHMATPRFAESLRRLAEAASRERVATMCAEGDWRRCHRRLLSDALALGGWHVHHILPGGGLEAHQVTGFASFEGGVVTYPAAQVSLRFQ